MAKKRDNPASSSSEEESNSDNSEISDDSSSEEDSYDDDNLFEDNDVLIVAGTYDGVLAGWKNSDNEKEPLKLRFAVKSHESSIRSLSLCHNPNENNPSTLLSCGYDDTIQVYNVQTFTEMGEIKPVFNNQDKEEEESTTPLCSDAHDNTHALIGFQSGKLKLYELKKDWDLVHVLSGHTDHGVSCVSIHPTGTMALSGGMRDSRIVLWDLTKGKRAYVYKIPSSLCTVTCIHWSSDGMIFGYAYNSNIVVKDVNSGDFLLDTEVSSQINAFCFLQDGNYVVCACNDASLVVLSTSKLQPEIRGLVAIEPIVHDDDAMTAAEERIKCLEHLHDNIVVMANSNGIVSVIDLTNTLHMMMLDDDDSVEEDIQAVEFLTSVRVGSGARITSLVVSCSPKIQEEEDDEKEEVKETVKETKEPEKTVVYQGRHKLLELDEEKINKARELVKKAKKRQEKKKQKLSNS